MPAHSFQFHVMNKGMIPKVKLLPEAQMRDTKILEVLITIVLWSINTLGRPEL